MERAALGEPEERKENGRIIRVFTEEASTLGFRRFPAYVRVSFEDESYVLFSAVRRIRDREGELTAVEYEPGSGDERLVVFND